RDGRHRVRATPHRSGRTHRKQLRSDVWTRRRRSGRRRGCTVHAVRGEPVSAPTYTPPPRPPREPVPTSPPTQQSGPIMRVVEASLRQPLLVALLALAIIGGGFYSLKRLPVDAYPDVSPPRVGITTQWPGHAAEEVERLITVPLETELNGLPNLVVTRSVSLYGLSSIDVTFTEGTDIYFARQQALERIGGASLPDGVD